MFLRLSLRWRAHATVLCFRFFDFLRFPLKYRTEAFEVFPHHPT